MNILTALNNQPVQDLLKEKIPDMTFPEPDIAYQEALLATLQSSKPDALLINLAIEGELTPQDFISLIRNINPSAKIVLVMKEENQEFKNWLVTKAVYDTFVDGQCSFEEIKGALTKKLDIIIKKEILVEEKILEKEKIITREKIIKVGFKKIILPVINSSETACEMAYCAARLTGLKVALINLDTYKGAIDNYLAVKIPSKEESFLFLSESKGGKTPNITTLDFCFEKPLENLYLLNLAAHPDKLLETNPVDLVNMLLACYSLFDLTIITISWGSSFIRHVACVSEHAVFVIDAFIDDLAATERLAEKTLNGCIPTEKQLYLFREYKSETCLSEAYLKEKLGERYLGKILYDDARCRSRNRDGPEGYYTKICFPYLRPQYSAILSRFDIYSLSTTSIIKNIFKAILSKKSDYGPENSSYTSQDMIFAIKEAYGILKYATYLFTRYITKLLNGLLKLIKLFLNPFLIIIFCILILIMAMTGRIPKDILNFLSQILHKGAN